MKPFRCGHKRTRENSVGPAWRASCRTCKQVRDREHRRHRPKPTEFRCGHPRSPENSATSGHNGYTCRMCKAVRDREYGRRGGKASAETKRTRSTLPRRAPLLRFELVSVQPIHEAQTGRSYSQFPLKRRSA